MLVSNDQTSTIYDPGTMDTLTTYYWKIVSEDEFGEITTGPVWSFTTADAPNTPPNTPTITGEQNGNAGTEYAYDFTATDSDGDDVNYYIDWGDGDTEWTEFFASGSTIKVSHKWTEQGNYLITAQSQDTNFLFSGLGTLEITMPVNQQSTHTLLELFRERFPLLYQLFIRVLEELNI